ncbi:MAG TPA: hypothetical protein VHE32_06795 [Rhodanobacteraceae bacterium]|nr:hypothetical protein [Rhodanobacteraceae bacterium]
MSKERLAFFSCLAVLFFALFLRENASVLALFLDSSAIEHTHGSIAFWLGGVALSLAASFLCFVLWQRRG